VCVFQLECMFLVHPFVMNVKILFLENPKWLEKICIGTKYFITNKKVGII